MSLRIVARQCFGSTKCLSAVNSRRLQTSAACADKEGEGLVLSPSCRQRLQEINAKRPQAKMLRLQVEGGGCSGFQYKFELDETKNQDDVVFGAEESCRVVVDEQSLELVKGSVIEYHTSLMKAAFRIAGNPQSEAACSCGVSFALKI